ncbi:hypothetical protein AVEN_164510-1 [Araneus ventricosus]|uniref:Uncharacterized protein n=1 Tax=Araneus ventricosus TaxID=182803 RepID=A0A4Y1ZWL6_ARAVE|nr:hypothetical protein AVEN_164510-1 [Araneus ventricosus]
MENSLVYPRGKEKQKAGGGEGKLERRPDIRVPRGRKSRHTQRKCAPECFCKADKLVCCVAFCNGLLKMRAYCSQILSPFIVATIGSFKPEIAVFDVWFIMMSIFIYL